MSRIRNTALGMIVVLVGVPVGLAQQPAAVKKNVPPRLVPVAETKLLMEGLAHPNFQGIERILTKDAPTMEAWTLARGQAILIAESANLMMLRPPRNAGQDAWMQHAAKMRDSATELARRVGKREHADSRSGLSALAEQCNRCHQSFRVDTKIAAFAAPNELPKPRNP